MSLSKPLTTEALLFKIYRALDDLKPRKALVIPPFKHDEEISQEHLVFGKYSEKKLEDRWEDWLTDEEVEIPHWIVFTYGDDERHLAASCYCAKKYITWLREVKDEDMRRKFTARFIRGRFDVFSRLVYTLINSLEDLPELNFSDKFIGRHRFILKSELRDYYGLSLGDIPEGAKYIYIHFNYPGFEKN